MGFFDNTPLPQTPAPEPPGYDLLRDIIMRRIFQLQSNPFGLSQGAQQNPGSVFSTGVMGGRLAGQPNGQLGGGGPQGGGMGGGGMQGGGMPQGGGGMGNMGSGMRGIAGGGMDIGALLRQMIAARGQAPTRPGPPGQPQGQPRQPMQGGQMPGGGGNPRFRIPRYDGQVIGQDAPNFPWLPAPGGAPQTPGPQGPPNQQPPGLPPTGLPPGPQGPPVQQPPGTAWGGSPGSPPFHPPGGTATASGGAWGGGGGGWGSGGGGGTAMPPGPTGPPVAQGGGHTANYARNPSPPIFGGFPPGPTGPPVSQGGEANGQMPWQWMSIMNQNQQKQSRPQQAPWLAPAGYMSGYGA